MEENATVLYYVTPENFYDVLHEAYLAIDNGGRNSMKSELKKMYCNVKKTRSARHTFVYAIRDAPIICFVKTNNFFFLNQLSYPYPNTYFLYVI